MAGPPREPTEVRAWGAFYVVDEAPGYKVKRIVVKPQGRLSLQTHKHRWEHWTVISGEVIATVGEAVLTLTRGESIDVPLGFLHRLENFGSEDAVLIEVQFGDYLGEDDIVRYNETTREQLNANGHG